VGQVDAGRGQRIVDPVEFEPAQRAVGVPDRAPRGDGLRGVVAVGAEVAPQPHRIAVGGDGDRPGRVLKERRGVADVPERGLFAAREYPQGRPVGDDPALRCAAEQPLAGVPPAARHRLIRRDHHLDGAQIAEPADLGEVVLERLDLEQSHFGHLTLLS